MAQPIELILVRHLGARLAVPLFLVDTDGTMVFYNEAAEQVLGQRFDDAGEMTFERWTSIFAVRDDAGEPLKLDELPLVKALRSRRPAHSRFDITGPGWPAADRRGRRLPARGAGRQAARLGGPLLGAGRRSDRRA